MLHLKENQSYNIYGCTLVGTPATMVARLWIQQPLFDGVIESTTNWRLDESMEDICRRHRRKLTPTPVRLDEESVVTGLWRWFLLLAAVLFYDLFFCLLNGVASGCVGALRYLFNYS